MANNSFEANVEITLTVNGDAVKERVPVSRHLVDFLRLNLDLLGSRVGCEHGVCGACTLSVNGEIVRGCLVLAAQLEGAEVWTVEGVSKTGAMRDLQESFVARNALQCGFCTPGMLFAAHDLLSNSETVPSREAIRSHLSGNYCRCTGYEAIVDAVETTALARQEQKKEEVVE